MRKFYIQQTGVLQKSLQNKEVFFYTPDGLGFENDISFMESDGFFFHTSEKAAQVNLTGVFVFLKPNAYDNYHSFISALLQLPQLTLVYEPTKGNQYFIDIKILSVRKSELTRTGCLETPVTFAPLSPWYSPEVLTYNVTIDSLKGTKQYEYTYPYRYVNTDVDVSTIINTKPDAHMPGAISINLVATSGTLSNLVLTLYSGGEPLGKVDLTGYTLPENSVLKYSSVPTNAYIMSDNTDLTSTVILDANAPTFFMVPPNTGCVMGFSADGVLDGAFSATITVYSYYRSV